MADTLPTIWEGPAHTFAKHEILKTYLQAWMPIMSRQTQRLGVTDSQLLFVDGFAGPGCYSGGEDGSPILAIQSVLKHSHEFHVPVSFLFIEKDTERCNVLRDAVARHEQRAADSPRIGSVDVKNDDCETVLNGVLDQRERAGESMGPAFFFLDQCGYSDVPMRLIQRIMAHPLCEVFSYLNWDHMCRFLVDQSKWPAIDMAFGGQAWRDVLSLELAERPRFMMDAYKKALREKGGSKYVWYFAMCDNTDKLLYWLFFCTNNLRGLEEMKKAMWKVDKSGGFRFSDREEHSQFRLFQNYDDHMLAKDLLLVFQGKVLSVDQVKEFTLSETPAYRYKSALKILENESQLRVTNPPRGRRKGTFADGLMQVEFLVRRA